ncbi:hypothetical protein WHR41_01272 [Cladosporium halotolerans]|uniref:Uncharacterized protein n=1 Tax=Cladosporium halotolerans TaxID=1052096 RepID=A0AB34L122_9PEZI
MLFSSAFLLACSAIAAIAAPTDLSKRDANVLFGRATPSGTGSPGQTTGATLSAAKDGALALPGSSATGERTRQMATVTSPSTVGRGTLSSSTMLSRTSAPTTPARAPAPRAPSSPTATPTTSIPLSA